MKARTRGWLVAAVGIVAIVGVGGTAHAFWTSSGTGSGGFETGSATAVVTLSDGAPTGSLRPGGSVAVATTATNPNATPLRISTLTLDTSRGSDGFAITGASGSCVSSSFAFAPSSAGWTVPANGTTSISMPGALSMTLSASNGCQGATVIVFLRAGA